MSLTGQCLCGAVRFAAPAAKPSAHACHCAMCRRWGGGPALAVDCGEVVRFEGEEHVTRFRSSDWAERAFCARCGSGLYWRPLEGAGMGRAYSMNAGLFDDQSRLRLGSEIFVDATPGWYAFSGDHPRLTEAETLAAFAAEAASKPDAE